MTTQLWLVAAAALLVAALAALAWRWWSRRGRLDVGAALRAVAIERLQNVLLPNGMGGQIQIEHLVLTGNGILVIDVKEFAGVIFASERMAEWTVIGAKGRFTFPNPLGTLYDRVAALRQLVRDVPVVGFVLFAGGADFSKGRPRDVLLANELLERYRKPEKADLERLLPAFAPHWERVKAESEPVTAGAR
jgi:Nuclease-related domain